MNQIEERLNKGSIETIIKELQTMISIAYIIAVGIGMLFNFKKFSQFGINIFDYADVLDFLIAPFADIIIIVFTIISVLTAYLLFKLDLYWQRKFPSSYAKMTFGLQSKTWYNLYRYIAYLFLFTIYLYLSASIYGKSKMRKIKEQPEITLKFADNEMEKGKIIGKTKDTIFLLNKGKVNAILLASLKKFEIK